MSDFFQIEVGFEKQTKNYYVFYDDSETLGRVYVEKTALKEIGWQYGQSITISVDVN